MVKVYDDEGLQASELLGCAQVKLSELEPGKVKDVWLKLVKDLEVQRDNKNRGQVRTLVTSFRKYFIMKTQRDLLSLWNHEGLSQFYGCLNYCMILGAPGAFVLSFWRGEWPCQPFFL